MKRVIILSGIPGSGKSTYTKTLEPDFTVSADSFFEIPGKGYVFNPAKLPAAHQECFLEAIGWLEMNTAGLLVVDNTNTSAWEIAPYVLAGEAYDASVEIHRLTVDVATAKMRNIHGVPDAVIESMAARFGKRDVLPWWTVREVSV